VPHFFTDARVVGPDFADVAPGEKGEIVVSGPNVMRGYWNGPDSVAGDWLHTGDVGSPDDDGYVSIVDRMKDMIISGGENIYPAEVEDVLDDHPAVAEAALIGVPDERWGEVGRAVVVLRPGVEASEEDILAYLRERLAKYKVPTSVVFADGLPRTATGKLLKSAIRSAYS